MPPQQVSPVTHAPTGGTPFASLWRTRGYLQPYLWQLAFMLAAAMVAVGTEIAIPLLTKAVIDGAIAHGRRGLLLPLGGAAIALGAAQAVLNLIRRWVQASAVTGMERSMRADLYAHLQRLHAGFHDEWQSGQLLSRATTDLSAIRRFAGFGTIFFITNVATFAVVVALLIHLNWWLGLLTGCVLLPVVVVSTRFERRYRVLSRQAQDQQGDLATYIEEAAPASACSRRSAAAARPPRGTASRPPGCWRPRSSKARLRGTFWAGLDLIPNTLIGLILLLGALATGRNELTLGGLVAFITLTLQLVWPIEATGYILASGQEAATAAQRIFEIFDTQPGHHGPRRRPGSRRARPARPSRLAFARVGFRYPGADRALLRGVSLDLEPGQTVVLDGRDRGGQDDPPPAGAPARRRDLRLHPARWHRHPAAPPGGVARPGGLRVRGSHAVLGERAGERRLRRAGRQ